MVNKVEYNKKIEKYYQQSNWLYKYFWYSRSSLGLNYGLWNKNTKNRFEAINNNFQSVIDQLNIRKGMKILDAGCGVGGGATYIAQKTKANVNGISISPTQILEAKKNANLRGVSDLTKFEIMDYSNTSFPDNYFDAVFGIESVCYAYPKKDFLKEAIRILKPGGKILIRDGYCNRKPKSDSEQALIRKFCDGWKLKELIEWREMRKQIRASGFVDINCEDYTERVKKSFRWMKFITLIAKPFLFIAVIKDNVSSLEAGMRGVNIGLFGYYTHIATKPKLR